MKNLARLLAALIFCYPSCHTWAEDIANGRVPDQVLSGSPDQTIAALGDIERLWPDHPDVYFEAVNRASENLSHAETPEAHSAISNLFSAIIARPCPTNEVLAAQCFKQKCEAILVQLNVNDLRKSKDSWLKVAKFIGEIRERRIPNFTPKTIYINPGNDLGLKGPQLEKAVQQNEQNKAINLLQQTLQSCDSKLSFHLLHNLEEIPNGTNDDQFVQKVISSAHLNEREQRSLR